MLKTSKSINLQGQSLITVEGREVNVVSMSANVYTDGSNSSITTVIVNKEVYNANKSVCRADIDSFTTDVREMEDNVSVESEEVE